MGRIDELRTFIKKTKLYVEHKSYLWLFTGDDEGLVDFTSRVLKKEPTNFVLRINRAIAYKRLNKTREKNADLKAIEGLRPYAAVAAGVAALRKNKSLMFRLLGTALDRKQLSLDELVTYPVFEDYHQDADFQRFIVKRREGRATS